MSEQSPFEQKSDLDPSEDAAAKRATVLQRIIGDLIKLGPEDRKNVLETVAMFFGSAAGGAAVVRTPMRTLGDDKQPEFKFSEPPTPKTFMFEKSPRTDVERVACLAYYLSRYRDIPHIKTKDISALNTESAHRPFGNATKAVDNATQSGYLVPSVKGAKQISALGERFVEALPDREAARQIFEQARQRRNVPGSKKA